MSRSKTKRATPRRARSSHFNLRDYIRDKWQATVFVAACVTIAHLGFDWLDAIDGHAFMVVSNLASNASEPAELPSKSAVVVRIDEQSFRTRYKERSPLDRCELASQLSAVYAAQPHLVVIDLDLSPVDWTRQPEVPGAKYEMDCQKVLEQTLAASVAAPDPTDPKKDPRGIRTVIIEPFDTFDPANATRLHEWQHRLERMSAKEGVPNPNGAAIRFGDAALPVSYGMTLDYFTGGHTLYAAARRDDADLIPMTGPVSRQRAKIDASAYRKQLKHVLTSWTEALPGERGAGYSDQDLTDTLRNLLPAPADATSRNRIVFFGAGYGQEDTFLTPVGLLYGVEVHAAAFVTSSPSPWAHVIALLGDILIGFVFGIIIVYCWTHYFAWRAAGSTLHGQFAWLWVAAMLVSLLVAMLLVLIGSWALLSRFNWWLSPVPIAIGMLIESCMAGSVEAAVERLHQLQAGVAPPVPAADSMITLSDRINTAVWGLTLAIAVGLAVWNH